MVETSRKYVFDFDSTLTQVEALDVLAEMTLKGKANRAEVLQEIQDARTTLWSQVPPNAFAT